MQLSSVLVWLIPIIVIAIGVFVIVRSFLRQSEEKSKLAQQSKNLTREQTTGLPIVPRDERDSFLAQEELTHLGAGTQPLSPNETSMAHIDTALDTTDDEFYEDVQSALDIADINPAHSINTDKFDTTNATTTQLTDHSDLVNANMNEHVNNLGNTLSSLEHATADIMPVINNTAKEAKFSGKSDMLDAHLQQQEIQDQNSPLRESLEVVSLTLLPNTIMKFDGETIIDELHNYGLKFGEMNLFHRYEETDGSGALWFSVMRYSEAENTSMPFDLQTLSDETVDGLTFFLPLPHPNAHKGIGAMLSMSGSIANDLNGILYTEDFKQLTREERDKLKEYVINFNG